MTGNFSQLSTTILVVISVGLVTRFLRHVTIPILLGFGIEGIGGYWSIGGVGIDSIGIDGISIDNIGIGIEVLTQKGVLYVL